MQTFRPAFIVASLGLVAMSHPIASPAPSPRQLVVRALDFMGGEPAVRAIRTRRSTSSELTYAIGQEFIPGGPATFGGITTTLTLDYGRHVFRRLQVPVGIPPERVATFVVHDDRMMITRDTIRARLTGPGSVAAGRSINRSARVTPEAILLAALDAPDSAIAALPPRAILGRPNSGIRARLPFDTLDLWFDVGDGRLTAFDVHDSDPIFGERVERTRFADWSPMAAVRLPKDVEITVNDIPIRRSAGTTELNAPGVDSLVDVPDSFTVTTPPAPVTIKELAPRIFRIEGGDGISQYGGGIPYYSVAVQQGDSIVLIETPMGDRWMREVLDSLHSRFPATPPRAFVVTHGHYDHASGARTAFAAGMKAIAARELTGFVKTVGLKPGEKPLRPRVVTPVDDSMHVGAGDTRFTLYRIPTIHAEGMLLAYFPATKLLVESDMQGAATGTAQHELVAWVRAKNLDIDRVAGLHGAVTNWAEWSAKVK